MIACSTRRLPLPVAVIVAAAMLAPTARSEAPAVTSQGMIVPASAPSMRTSPAGSATMDVEVVAGERGRLTGSIVVTTSDGSMSAAGEVPGSAFFISDVGRVVAIETPDTHVLPSTIRVLDLDGSKCASLDVRALSDPALSSDGTSLAYATPGGVVVLDLTTLATTTYPRFASFAAGPRGFVAGGVREAATAAAPRSERTGPSHRLVIFEDGRVIGEAPLRARPGRVAFGSDGSSVLALSAGALEKTGIGETEAETLFEAPPGARLRDLAVRPDEILVGVRTIRDGSATGTLVRLAPDGRLLSIEPGPSVRIPRATKPLRTSRGIPWPLAPNAQHPVGNTYGEYQNYGGGGYLHPGVDAMGNPGQPVYAAAAGVVKATFTTSGEFHWRVAVGDSPTPDPCGGYLYAHLEEFSIAVDVGDTVAQGDYLGDLVEWPIYDFTHVHFARIEDEGVEWLGDWLNTENPHLDFDNQTELAPPVFEPARGSDLLAFCVNETSIYRNPSALSGVVDIIAHVGDTIESSWVCTVQEIRYTIYPVGYPEFPVVDDKLALFCDMVLDTYIGGPIDPFLVGLLYKRDGTCYTQGDYDFREFYHVITNSDGDQIYEESDHQEAWDTTTIPDADYVIRVTARDVAGNATADSMVVTTANGGPSWTPEAGTDALALHPCFPNPAGDGASISFTTPVRDHIRVSIFDAGGRLVRRIADTPFIAGRHTVTWDGKDSRGNNVAAGAYFVRAAGTAAERTARMVVLR